MKGGIASLAACCASTLGTISLLLSPLVLAQQDPNCVVVDRAADASYDFTGELSRWGSKDSYNMDAVPHHVRSITINRLPIFDESNPDENNWLYQLANRLHITTQEHVISDQLLFEEDSLIDAKTLAESERILRKRKFIGDARIRVLQDCAAEVDLEVVSKEVWTLTPELTFKSTGGHASTGIGIRDSNILGTGQFVSLRYKHDQDRNSAGFVFNNPNINGSRMAFISEFDKNSDGHHYLVDTALPFYSLDTPYAWDVLYQDDSEMLSQYQYGARISQLVHEMSKAEVSAGFAALEHGNNILRYSVGLHAERNKYRAGLDYPTPAGYADSLDLNYPFLQFELVEDAYSQGFNLTQIQRTEDIYTGRHLTSRIGYATGRDSGLIFNGSFSDTLLHQPRNLLQVNASWDAWRNQNSSQWQNTLVSTGLDFYRGQTEKRILYLGLEATHAWNLVNGKQLELGGNNGLRGFDTHFLNGTGSVRFTAEERYYTNLHVFNLLRVGYAAYVDTGRVYGSQEPDSQRFYTNIGLGLRLSPSKSESGQVIHVDLAWPLGSNIPGGDGFHLLAEVRKSF